MIRKAVPQDIDQVEQGYMELLLHEQAHGAYTAWKLGVYPTRRNAEESLAAGSLYVMENSGEIFASMILDQCQPPEYAAVPWPCTAEPREILVLHLLCVRPSKSGHGIGREMVRFAIGEGRRLRCKAVRLDTGAQNLPAASLYRKLGFSLAGSAGMAVGGLIVHGSHLFFEKNLEA